MAPINHFQSDYLYWRQAAKNDASPVVERFMLAADAIVAIMEAEIYQLKVRGDRECENCGGPH